MGLYFHIPFCAQKCGYCDFYSLANADNHKIDAFCDALLRHMRETASFTGKASHKNGGWMVDSLYFGGGTPSFLGAKRIVKLVSAAQKLWQISQSAEITMEGNPDSLEYKSLKRLRKAGVNRLSVGVQAVQPELLRSLGRVHTAEQAADCVREAKRAGFDNISVDLMYGIPGQTADMLAESLKTVLSWGIQHISLYGLKLEEGTPMYGKAVLPSDDAQAAMYLAAVHFLEKNGFEQYEISNFAQPSRHSRHNLKYWTLEPYIGFGPAAHSDFGGKRYGHVRNLDAYIEGVNNGDVVIDEMNRISPLERAGEYVMLGLRTARGISGNEYIRMYKVSLDPVEKKLELLEKHGFAQRVGERWRLTPKGFLVSNRILTELLGSEVEGNFLSFN